MSYKALLFCPEEKTARVVTQVLSELEFQVEPCNEPFAAVKRLMAEHFDAVVVDCENEQNATLLFRSAKNSGSNQTSLSVAVVEGQSGVAKAFRIGANLVLTKPINVEQSKGTLRVARGLLRKTDGSRTATLPAISEPHSPAPSTGISNPKPAVPSVTETPKVAAFTPPPPAAPPAPVASAGSQFELDAEPEVKLEPTEAALLESMPDPLAGKAASMDQSSIKPSPWQPASQAMAEPMASALKHATDAATEPSATAAARNNSMSAAPSRPVLVSSHGAAAAAAPAKVRPEIDETTRQEIEPPAFSSSIGQPPASESGASKKMIVIAASVLVVAAVSYFGWKNKAALGAVTGVLHKPTIPAPAKPATTQPSSVPATLAPPYSAEVVATPAPVVPERKPVSNNETPILATTAPATTVLAAVTTSPAPKKPASAPKAIAEAPAPVKTIADDGAADALVVKGNSAKPVIQPAPPQEEVADANAPEASSIASGSDSSAVSGLVSLPTNTPQAAPQTLKVSQGVSQGLLIKKVAPVYPPQALRMGVQGAVQLSAHISKSGDITNIQVLSGDNLLSQAAVDAVKQWKYKPYYLDSQPVEIQTQITMNFKLP
jgi:periplasmic protein TonB